jgi:cytochrome c oxidase cbb3-type subunit 4
MAEFIQSLWLLWLFLLFVGIVAWVYWPKRKKKMDEAAQIPLKDDEER